MKSSMLFAVFLLSWVAWANISQASLNEWDKTRLEVVGGEVPVLQTMEDLRATFTDSLVCSACHPNHYSYWSLSYHAKSIQNAGFQALYLKYLDYLKKEEALKELGREPSADDLRQCLFCHAPQVQFASDELVQQISDAIAAGKWEEIRGAQISCVICHSITPEGKWSSESFKIDGTLYGPIRKPVSSDRSRHKSQYSELHSKPEFCAICHSRQTFNVYCSLVYEQFRETAASKQGKTCQDCHMEGVEEVEVAIGGKKKRTIHSHLFPGGRFGENWKKAIDLSPSVEKKNPSELLLTVIIQSKVPHNIPDG